MVDRRNLLAEGRMRVGPRRAKIQHLVFDTQPAEIVKEDVLGRYWFLAAGFQPVTNCYDFSIFMTGWKPVLHWVNFFVWGIVQ
jgi:hypothetical protein